ncbi:hypothetical protein IGI04_042686 [Brassica rapa subsp. trilocularis]|uniref:Uncharacterized protein n=1 Tax=Brassica rapa subsp. trilocularis TaxID=1813537 RepID=A0ABQ7KKE9_BRACM|nr:hypothetical protein IGI04_042686 [Brassica rapa subsp. trilocularis]
MKVFGISQEGDKAMCIVRDSGTDRRSVPSTVRPLHTPKSSGSAQIKMCNVRASQVAQTPGKDFRNKHKLQLTPVQLSSLSPKRQPLKNQECRDKGLVPLHIITRTFSVLSLRGSLNAYDPWSVTSLCKGSYKGSSAGVILGSLRVKVN